MFYVQYFDFHDPQCIFHINVLINEWHSWFSLILPLENYRLLELLNATSNAQCNVRRTLRYFNISINGLWGPRGGAGLHRITLIVSHSYHTRRITLPRYFRWNMTNSCAINRTLVYDHIFYTIYQRKINYWLRRVNGKQNKLSCVMLRFMYNVWT